MMIKPIKKLILALSLIIMTSNCSHQAVYDNIQLNRKNTCSAEPNTQVRNECLKGLGTDYKDYKSEREKLLLRDKQ